MVTWNKLVCLLKNGNLEQIGLLIEKGKRTVTSGGVRRYRDGLFLTDVHDLAAFDFSEPCSELPALRNCFFEFKALPPDTLSDKVVGIIVSGYPFDDQNYDLENNRHLGQAKRIVLCKLDGPDQPRDQALLRLRTLERLNFSPDGISGGGAFVVQLEGLEARAYFAGIVTRAGRDHVHIVKSPFIQQFMDAWISRSGRAE
ncbi:hypothetical protein [Roseibium aggregatum]|uniref:hypothetical protein n=1 Tax=Roseibium aggregatum TaxID=187304 RepID=UPI001E2A27B2|nr:hypothetical protein [Roseibium aggregatum]UES49687.1 hypothetical protein GFK88_08730 [Roseibium aggregatum]